MSKGLLKDIIEEFDTKKFSPFFHEKNRSFAPITEVLPEYNENFKEGLKLGEIKFSSVEKLIICSFKVIQPLSERSGKKNQYELGKKILKNSEADAGIFIFYDENGNFRFSLIYANYLGNRRDWNTFKRFTYFVSKGLTNKTFLEQIGEGDFSTLQKIKEAFSVEPVTKKFYNDIQNWYFWAMDKIKFPDDYNYSDDPEKDKEIRNATNLIRLITRVIFIWFLKEKGLISQDLFSKKELKDIVKDFGNGNEASNFYNAILQNLFFATLNQKMSERKFAEDSGYPANKKEYGVKNLYRYADKFLISKDKVLELFKDIPFLNGGLFDCLDKEDESGKVIYIDGFSRNPKKQAIIPDYLFFQEKEEKIDLSFYGLGANKSIKGLIEILNSYNFTIDENTPVDQEIALDPELLGKVFENLLACYNPETATTARKATGSYYTPREIVDYMVDESLIAYLSSVFTSSVITPSSSVIAPTSSVIASEAKQSHPPLSPTEATQSHPSISTTPDSPNLSNNIEQRLRQLLSYSDSEETLSFSEEEKNRLISAIANIKILDPACGSGAFPMGILHKLVNALQKLDPGNKYWHELHYQRARKESEEIFKHTDKNEKEESLKEIKEAFDEGINHPDYARKLYLIENCIYGVDIQPIAIQISKLRFFISLILDQKVDKSKENFGIRPLPNLETKFVAANTLIGLDKPEHIFYTEKIKALEDEIKFLRHKYFQAKTRTEKLRYQEKDKNLRNQLSEGLKYIGYPSVSSEKIAKFDLYDQNASADWFDPEWMFGVTDGFDIVIGNPPYIRQEDLTAIKPILRTQGYEVYNSTSDIYTYFYEKGWQVLKKGGILCFITSNKWMRAKYGEKIRKFFKENTLLKQIIDFGGHRVFESATVDTNILIFQKNNGVFPNQKDWKVQTLSINSDFNRGTDLLSYFKERAIIIKQSSLDQKCFTFGDEAVMRLKKKIEEIGVPLKNWDVKIYYGIKTGFNEAFIIDNETKERLCKEDPKSAEILKQLLRGRDIGRYYYKWAGLWLIYSYQGIEIDKYPVLKRHLSKYKIPLEKRTGGAVRDKRGNIVKIPYKWYELQVDNHASINEFEKEKIVWQRVTKTSMFCLVDKGMYVHDSMAFLTAKNLQFLLAILNSKVVNKYFESIAHQYGNTGFLCSNQYVEQLPIPKIPESDQQPFIYLVDKILNITKDEDYPDNPTKQAQVKEYEHQIDQMVYKLYGLTKEEINIVEGK